MPALPLVPPAQASLCLPGQWFSPWKTWCWRFTWCWPPSRTPKVTCSPPRPTGKWGLCQPQLPSVGTRVNGPQSAHSLFSPSVSHLPTPSDDFTDDLESYMIAMETSAYEDGPSGVPPSPTFPLHTPRPAESDPEEKEEEEEEGAVPGTPPHKKVWGGHSCAWGQVNWHSPLLTLTSLPPHSFAPCFLALC